MKKIPESIQLAWKKRMGAAIFTTVDNQNQPNSIYVKSIVIYNDNKFLIADNYFGKTRGNIQQGSKGSILFMVNEMEAYQIKGNIRYYTEGEFYNDMKKWNNPKHPGHAVVVLEVEEVYCGSKAL
jgi:predicted pyridoxine 5'-phosphate oxidase superfamily flavin-nucleotide-binding protein